MPSEGKVWGKTELIVDGVFYSVHLLHLDQGGFCSEHFHHRKINRFHVLTGRLQIHIWPAGVSQDQPDTTELSDGQGMVVANGIWHSFTAITPCVLLEIYEAAPIEEDIIRRSVGGNINRIRAEE